MSGLSDRVSDAEREQTVAALRDDLLAGRLTLEEFSERVEIAYRARVGQDLVDARTNLPHLAPGVGRSRRPTRLTAALFGHVVRRGRLRLARWTVAAGVFADVDLDLREAEIDTPLTAVNVLVAFGNVDVYVPQGIDVDVNGVTVFGRRREWGRDAASPDAPTLHVRILGVFGTVDVWRVPHQMRGSYSEIFRQMEEQQRQLSS